MGQLRVVPKLEPLRFVEVPKGVSGQDSDMAMGYGNRLWGQVICISLKLLLLSRGLWGQGLWGQVIWISLKLLLLSRIRKLKV